MKNYYFVIRSEYIYDLKLHGIERDTFAVIDSCFHAGSRWRGPLAKLAYMIGASARSVERSVKSLIDNNFICMFADGSLVPSESALAILDKDDKMSEASDKMSRQNVVQKKEAKKTEINNTGNVTSSSNTEVISDEEYDYEMLKIKKRTHPDLVSDEEIITTMFKFIYSSYDPGEARFKFIEWLNREFPKEVPIEWINKLFYGL